MAGECVRVAMVTIQGASPGILRETLSQATQFGSRSAAFLLTSLPALLWTSRTFSSSIKPIVCLMATR